jgi:hypothetical protein
LYAILLQAIAYQLRLTLLNKMQAPDEADLKKKKENHL